MLKIANRSIYLCIAQVVNIPIGLVICQHKTLKKASKVVDLLLVRCSVKKASKNINCHGQNRLHVNMGNDLKL
jgi:hypothetical protein